MNVPPESQIPDSPSLLKVVCLLGGIGALFVGLLTVLIGAVWWILHYPTGFDNASRSTQLPTEREVEVNIDSPDARGLSNSLTTTDRLQSEEQLAGDPTVQIRSNHMRQDPAGDSAQDSVKADDAAVQTSKHPLKYQLDRRQPLIYSYQSTVKMQGETLVHSGRIQYQILDQDPSNFIAQLPLEVQEQIEATGNGTGWVVHPDGWIVTCAHVVKGLDQIDVFLNNQQFVGEIVEVNDEVDLALVKVNGTGHRYLRLSTNLPKLGATAKIFGFPLADQLGSSMKMTSGSVSGRDQVGDQGFRLHLDATANPGNSGGPVTDADGAVMGIADSILNGSELADMSFAVPVRELVEMLKAHQISFVDSSKEPTEKNARGTENLLITDLEDVSEAVALLEISKQRNKTNWKLVRFELASSAQLDRSDDPFARMQAAMSRLSSPLSGRLSGHLILDDVGEVIYSSENNFLPSTMQNRSCIGLFPLARREKEKWSRKEKFVLLMESHSPDSLNDQLESMLDHLSMHGGFGSFGRPRRQQAAVKEEILLVDVEEIFTRKADPNQLVFTRQIQTTPKSASGQQQEYSIAGELEFNPTLGFFQKGTYCGNSMIRVEGKNVPIETQFSFSLESADSAQHEHPQDNLFQENQFAKEPERPLNSDQQQIIESHRELMKKRKEMMEKMRQNSSLRDFFPR